MRMPSARWTVCVWCVLATVAAASVGVTVQAGIANAVNGHSLRLRGGGCLDCFGGAVTVPAQSASLKVQVKEIEKVPVKGAAVEKKNKRGGLKMPKQLSGALRLVFNNSFLITLVAAGMLVKVKINCDEGL
jgi:hypothetical protein